jgi:amino acid adenylation domain-containing protein
MVPAAIVLLDELPLTANGKLDANALPAPELTRDTSRPCAPPRDELEVRLTAIWSEVLGVERIGIHDDFFALGGHSLLATRVVARVRDQLERVLPLRAIFSQPTIAGLARLLRESAQQSGDMPLEPRKHEDGLPPLSWAQERLWFLDQLEPESAAYNLPWMARLRGPLQVERLQQALDALAQRHESLRTTFGVRDGEPVQLIGRTAGLTVAKQDCLSLQPADLDAHLRGLVSEPFDLHTGPLLRAHLLRVGTDEHILILVMHHIVSDGWSMGVLLSELAELYAGLISGVPARLPDMPLQYADFAIWQRKWLSGAELERQLDYWRRQLEDAPPLLDLPLDFPRPPVQRYQGGWRHHNLDKGLARELTALATRESCTLFMLLLAAFKLLLARHTGSDDIVVGTPIAGRGRTELEGLIGFFLNTLALRTRLDGEPTFLELLARTRTTTIDAYDHQELPFEKLLEVLQPARSTAHSPVVQVMFNLQNAPAQKLALPDIEVEPFVLGRGTAKFDLSVVVSDTAHGLQVGIEYNTDLFTDATVTKLLDQFEQILREVSRDPQQRVSAIRLATPPDYPVPDQLPAAFAKSELETSVPARFALMVQKYPQRNAVESVNHAWSYAELDRRANAVAWALEGYAGSRIGICLPHDAPAIAAILGVLKAGCAYVPLDQEAPSARREQIIREAEIAFVVDSIPAEGRDDAPDLKLSPDDLAYILFTSGSTGTPKGVMQNHRNLLHHARTYIDSIGINEHDRLSLLSAYGFDAAAMDIYGALLSGGCVCPVDLRSSVNPLAELERLNINVWHSTPTVFRLLLADTNTLTPDIRAVVLGGEEALVSDFEMFRRRFARPALFVNGLGPSESTLALQFFANHDTELAGNTLPVGLPVDGVQVRLVNDAGEPAGLTGELALRSRFVSTGYWRQAELTSEKFTPVSGGEGLVDYLTGDRLYVMPDGQFAFAGRVDQQVKLRGHRIEPGEIEQALKAEEGVERCAVVICGNDGESASLVAYVVGLAGAEELKAALRSRLPDYMVPAAFVKLDELPLTSNGKLDRNALPAPVLGRDPKSAQVGPRNATEEALKSIWSEVLSISEIGIHDDFFALGGHSLIATRLVARIRDGLGHELPLRAVFAHPTIAELAALLGVGETARDEVPLQPRAQTGELPPLSWAQQRLWFLDQLEPESAAYNLHWAARLTGHLKLGALQSAVAGLVARHESLRTRFVSHAGEPVQVILRSLEVPVRAESLPGARDATLQTRLLELVRENFDLTTGPLLRVHVVQVSDEEAVLLLVMHHIVSDGWSMGVLFDELARLYNAEIQGQSALLPALQIQYADFAIWQRAWLSGEQLDRQVEYWRAQLKDAPPMLELPLDHARPPVQRYRGAWVNQTFSPELLERLRRLAAREGCTLFMVLLAAFKLLLARHTGSEDIVVGTPIAGRRRTELEALIGFFLNTLALRTDISGNPSFVDLLARVKATTLDAYDHQELPFEKLLEVLQPQRSTAHTPIVQVIFNLHNEPTAGLSLAGLAVSPFSIDRGTAKFDLSVALVEGASGLQAGFEYNTDLFERQTVELLLRHYGELLWGIVRDSSQSIASYGLTSAAMAPAVPAAMPDLLDRADSIPECFAAAVRRHAERPAVATAGQTWSYRELDERANAVAMQLRDYPGERVGLLLGHDGRMLAGLLGALKAGCTYVALDPDAPVSRLQQIIADAEIRAVVADVGLRALLAGETGLEIIEVDESRRAESPELSIAADELAYILFTSGSTGVPKGVMQTHGNVVHHVHTYIRSLKISSADRLSLLPAYGFDAAVMDIFAALFTGACLYPMKLRDEEYPGQLLDRMGEHRISILHATPTLFRHLMRNKVCRHDLSCVRIVVLGGEEALANDFALFRKQFAPPALFVNGLGPSESTLALQFFADHGTRLPGNTVPVGSPVAGTEVLLLNKDGTEAGIVGELAIRSRYVSKGYWKQPELTAERFIADPENPDKVLYLTGDRARYLPDGQLVFIGRVDDQVKVRGHRIEPGEIEATALTVDGVERCAVVLNRAERGEPRLVAYVVGDADISVLRAELRAALPGYMIPSVFMHIQELPLTSNGKLDRNALPEPPLTRDDREAYVEPRNDIEVRLAAIWSEVLGVDRIGVHDDFFELGGHSLMAAQLVARVTDTLQVGLPIRRLFDSPTIAGIAEHVETLRWALEADREDG